MTENAPVTNIAHDEPDGLEPRTETDLITFDQLFENLKAQHAIKYDRYLVLKSQVDAISNKPQQGNNTFDLREVQKLRDAGKKAHDEGDHAKSEKLLNEALALLNN